MLRKECVAMLLAGGQGSRLGCLTRRLAKPAVPFGGKYRIIDFALSNCYNSGLDTVGVLTQYQPLTLHSYIGIGTSWDLDRKNGGVFVLPPYLKDKGGEWYRGTADAICQNMNFLELFRPEYVLVLSGDHIYKMDYSLMLDYHKESRAEATIAVIEVPWEEASRFGIMNAGPDGRIREFAEKPQSPQSNLASMGVYIFTWDVLRHYLQEDVQDKQSSHDFGKNIIPKMLFDGRVLNAYHFDGYWKDVGTVESFWEANMDLLKDESQLDLYDPAWPIYSVNSARPPHFVAETAKIACSLIGEGCLVQGTVERSVLFPGVQIGPEATVKDSVVMPYARIGAGAQVIRAIVGRRSVVEEGCRVGSEIAAMPIAVIEEGARICREGSREA
ncbi:adp-glucose pyrophosphorylase signature 2 [Lucifera butyrica]|uniref:Glucose-1-phosphate adenylyltransferase n=1 Tax=Lucifera butyrica TaxID=1351585 RepID=A0A498R1L1_9FIRM|nr:glucose-1-phosphate adenylyltransferase [Lucifera butyrica]VBB05045.1 adp-glucose pyrophosphorylase signature 2 [Lucifera butyrica]